MPALKRQSSPEIRGLYANANRFTPPQGTVPRLSNLYMIRRGALQTVPGSKWISSFDGAAPHATNQQPIKALSWYCPSIGSAPDQYLTGQANVTLHNFVMALQLATPGTANLVNVSQSLFLTENTVPANITQPNSAHGYQLNMAQFGDYLITALGNTTPPRIYPVTALLSQAIGNGDTTIPVMTTISFPGAGYFFVDTEAIQYNGKTATSFTGCTRGALGTTAASHANGALVTYGVNIAGSFQARPWSQLGNQFIATNVYPPWPGTGNASSPSPVAVNINTLITAFDGNNVYWIFKAENSGFTGSGTGYWGPQFWPAGVYGGGSMTAGSGTLTAIANTPFTAAMVGLPCTVAGAGAGGGPLVTTVAAYTDSSHVNLTATAATTTTQSTYSIGTGNYNDAVQDHDPVNNTGTITWLNVGRASLPAPGAAYVFQHLNYLFLWGVGQSYGTDGITGPDALWQSDAGVPNSFNAANTTFVGKGDGTEAQGGAIFSLSEAGIAATPQLVLFKDSSTWSFLDAFPNASLVPASGGVGCIAPCTIQYIGGTGVMRLSYQGFALFDGQLEHITEYTDAIQGYLYGGLPDVTPVDLANIQNATSAQVINPPMYLAFLPLQGGSGYPTRAFGYDFALKQWTIIDLPFAIGASCFLPQAAAALSIATSTLVGGNNDGVVRRLFAADPDWDGTAVNWTVRLPDMGFPGTPIYARRLNMRIQAHGGGAAPQLTAVNLTATRRSGTQLSRPLNVPTAIYGTMDIGEVFVSGNITVTGQGQVLIEGSDLQISDKPMSRVGI